jgi:hypothetical protein
MTIGTFLCLLCFPGFFGRFDNKWNCLNFFSHPWIIFLVFLGWCDDYRNNPVCCCVSLVSLGDIRSNRIVWILYPAPLFFASSHLGDVMRNRNDTIYCQRNRNDTIYCHIYLVSSVMWQQIRLFIFAVTLPNYLPCVLWVMRFVSLASLDDMTTNLIVHTCDRIDSCFVFLCQHSKEQEQSFLLSHHHRKTWLVYNCHCHGHFCIKHCQCNWALAQVIKDSKKKMKWPLFGGFQTLFLKKRPDKGF